MLRMIGEFADVVVLSIRTGDVVGKVTAPIIQPEGLNVAGFFVKPLREREDKVLVASDVREIGLGGLIIDDEEKLMDKDDLIRLKDVIKIDYKIIGKKVQTDKGRKIGKAQDYAVDDLTWEIQKIYAGRSILSDLTSTGVVIDRKQITEVTDKKIIVNDVDEKATDKMVATSLPAA